MAYPAKIFSAFPGRDFLSTLLRFLQKYDDAKEHAPYRLVFPHEQGVRAWKNLLKESQCQEQNFARKAQVTTLKETLLLLAKDHQLSHLYHDQLALDSFLLRFVKAMPKNSYNDDEETRSAKMLEALSKDLLSLFAEHVQETTLQQADIQELIPQQQRLFLLLKESLQAWHLHCENTKIFPSLYHVMDALQFSKKSWKYHTIFAGLTFQEDALIPLVLKMLSQGKATIILPGYRVSEGDALVLQESHPHASMERFCSSFGKGENIVSLNECPARWELLSTLFTPEENLLHIWKKMDPHLVEKAMKGVTHIVTQDEASECYQTALLARCLLQKSPQDCVAIVSPSSFLLETTARELLAWNICGSMTTRSSLYRHPWGQLFEESLTALYSLRPDHVMTMLWNPLCAENHKALLHDLETSLGRQKNPSQTWENVAGHTQEVQNYVRHIHEQLLFLGRTLLKEKSFQKKWRAHSQTITTIIATSCEEKATQYQKWSQRIEEATQDIGDITHEQYKPFLFSLLKSIDLPKERHHPTHAHLFLRSPMDQRLQREKTVLMLGMNAHDWPGSLPHKPFLTSKIRTLLRMGSADRWLSPKAHDWIQSMMASEVYLFSSLKKNGIATQESPFLKRLKIFLRLRKQEHLLKTTFPPSVVSEQEHANTPPIKEPIPKHPFALPRRTWRISVSSLSQLKRNAYCFYASSYLGLKIFSPLSYTHEQEESAKEGTLLHKILESYMRQGDLPTTSSRAHQRLVHAWRGQTHRYPLGKIHEMFFLSRLEKISKWLVHTDIFQNISDIKVEQDYIFLTSLPKISLTGRGDLLLYRHGNITLWDYKTGSQRPSRNDPQLPLLAFLHQESGQAGTIAKMGFLFLPRGRKEPEIKEFASQEPIIKDMANTHFLALEQRLKEHLSGRPFLWDKKYAFYRDKGPGSYQHLARSFGPLDEIEL